MLNFPKYLVLTKAFVKNNINNYRVMQPKPNY